jgi:histidine ammonia-lyase
MSAPSPVFLGHELSLADFADVVLRGRAVAVDAAVAARVRASRAPIDAIAHAGDEAPSVYGVNTGFGALAETRISASDVRELQLNLVRSHAVGLGAPLPIAAVRGMLLLRAQVLALGHSGVRLEVLTLLAEMLNRGVHPRIPSQGSVGASGDLAPLAHLALALVGEGRSAVVPASSGYASYDANEPSYVRSTLALASVGLTPIALEAKEGLALINGTQYMASLGTLALLEAEELCTCADVIGAMSLEALKGTSTPFDARLQAARPHPGQSIVAGNLRRLLAESAIADSHRDCEKVQDPYSLRCMPQIHGASRDALAWVRTVLEREINSVTDNPSVFLREGGFDLLSGGNFHGQILALALDLAAMAVAELANVSERRVEQLVNPALSTGLTPFLAAGSGLHSGFMIAQVAAASLVSENKVFAHPASVDSIPSSAGREDHVSMGSVSARKLGMVVANVRKGLALELMVAAAGVDQRAPLAPSSGVSAALACVRKSVAPMTGDRILADDVEALEGVLARGELRRAVEGALGALA